MGLNEKRKMKELQDGAIPERTKELLEITGSAVTYDIDWATFQDTYEALNFLDNVACHRLNMALRVICADQLGKDAIKESLKKVRIVNVKDAAGKKLEFGGGVFTMTGAYAAGLSGAFSDNEIREKLMAGL
ncbi:MAG: hypothetical protein IT452_19330 [Planctomycetia bacterium]|nr:hypothetical protein [Planctomycetia bacterium]